MKKYVRPILVIVGLAAITAIVIYILGEGMFEEGFESLTYESRTVINNFFGEQDAENIGVREGGRMEIESNNANMPESREEATAKYFEMRAEAERRLKDQEKRERNKARRAERARRAMEKLHRIEGKNVLIANVGIGNA